MRAQLGCALLCAVSIGIEAGEVRVNSPAEGLALFKPDKFNVQCWQEGQKVLDEEGVGLSASADDLVKPQLVFHLPADDKKQVMIMTLGRSLCMIKST
ncbi:MAG: hypothetical protein AB8C02_19035 [Halioglobus sp.]